MTDPRITPAVIEAARETYVEALAKADSNLPFEIVAESALTAVLHGFLAQIDRERPEPDTDHDWAENTTGSFGNWQCRLCGITSDASAAIGKYQCEAKRPEPAEEALEAMDRARDPWGWRAIDEGVLDDPAKSIAHRLAAVVGEKPG